MSISIKYLDEIVDCCTLVVLVPPTQMEMIWALTIRKPVDVVDALVVEKGSSS